MGRVSAGTLRLGLVAAHWLGAGPASAVVGGTADDGPSMRASVMVLSSNGGVCSAVVVAPDAVLTAAHCATGAAEHRVHYKEGGEAVLLAPAAVAVHPSYDAGAIAARRRSIDLAIVRLGGPLPARFEMATLSAAVPAKDAVLTLGGWGVSAEGEPRTSGTFRTAALRTVEPHGPSRILLWARGAAGTTGAAGVGACRGDSGGPIASGTGVVAVSAWATGTGAKNCGALTQGVLLGPQRGWIDRVLAGWGRSARWE